MPTDGYHIGILGARFAWRNLGVSYSQYLGLSASLGPGVGSDLKMGAPTEATPMIDQHPHWSSLCWRRRRVLVCLVSPANIGCLVKNVVYGGEKFQVNEYCGV